jgi:hypothetical protein
MDEDNFIDYEKRSHLDENQLEYHLFIFNQEISTTNIEHFYDQLNETIKKLSLKYIWNNEIFLLNKPKLVDQNLYLCEGIIDFADNIDDEWFIVYLLIELTLKYKNKICCQVEDSDGEFLLIHLANYLPKWASNSLEMKNRVFLYNNELHIIPPATNPSQITYLPAHGAIKSAIEAVKIVSDFSSTTRSNEILQQNLRKRVEPFKNYEKLYLHQTTCTIPAKLAWLLSPKSGSVLLSRAINRFCDKDPSDLKLCRSLKTFQAENLIDYRVTFTKFLYCKLKYCDFNADKRHHWPKINEISNTVAKDRLQLGLKLTCAFELLSKLEENELGCKNFQSYIENLDSMGYFKGCIKDSQEYRKLYESAKVNFSHTVGPKIKDCLSGLPDNYLDQLNKEIDLIQKQNKDDNDDWLHVDQTHLDDYLEMYSSGNVSSTYDFKLISDAFKKFLDLKQPSESVEFKAISKDDEELVDFNVNSIESNLHELLNRKIDDNDEDDESVESDSFYEINRNELSEEDEDDENKNLKEYIKAMDNELESEKDLAHFKTYGDTEDEEEENDDRMLNLDVNLVSNAIESYSSQLGLTGPVSNILKSLGI